MIEAYERVMAARAKGRPTSMSFIENIFTDFTEMHGDRRFADALARQTLAFENGKLVRYEGEPSAIERAKSAPKPEPEKMDGKLLDLRLAEVISRLSLPRCPDKEALEREFQELLRQKRAIAAQAKE